MESIGRDNRKLMEAACHRHWGAIEVAITLQDDEYEKSEAAEINAILGESLFHNKASAQEDGLDDLEECADYGDDTPEDIQLEISQRV